MFFEVRKLEGADSHVPFAAPFLLFFYSFSWTIAWVAKQPTPRDNEAKPSYLTHLLYFGGITAVTLWYNPNYIIHITLQSIIFLDFYWSF